MRKKKHILEKPRTTPLPKRTTTENVFVTETYSTVSSRNELKETKKMIKLQKLHGKYSELRNKYKSPQLSALKRDLFMRRRLRDNVDNGETAEHFRGITTNSPKTETPREMKVIKQSSYQLLSANENNSPVGILLKSLARTIRRMKNKERDRS